MTSAAAAFCRFLSYGRSSGLPRRYPRGPAVHETKPFDDVPEHDLLCDPTEKLAKVLQVPLFPEGQKPYRPSKDELELAQHEVFSSRKKDDVSLVEKTIHYQQAPVYNLPEVAFLGRSNVGKSSLIRALFHRIPGLKVPVSKTPGYTKALRFYRVKDLFTLVDMPGYGFGQPEYFEECVEGFLRNRQNLTKTFLLLDAASAQPEDWTIMERSRMSYCIVLNKIDLVKESDRLRLIATFRRMRDQHGNSMCFPQPFMVSSTTGEGLAYIQAFIAHITGSYALVRR